MTQKEKASIREQLYFYGTYADRKGMRELRTRLIDEGLLGGEGEHDRLLSHEDNPRSQENERRPKCVVVVDEEVLVGPVFEDVTKACRKVLRAQKKKAAAAKTQSDKVQ